MTCEWEGGFYMFLNFVFYIGLYMSSFGDTMCVKRQYIDI